MSRTNQTIDLLERSPTRVNLPVKVKTPTRMLLKKKSISSDIQRNNGYKVYSYCYRERKPLKNHVSSIFTLSNQLLLSSKAFDSDLTVYNAINPLSISTSVIDFIQCNESTNKTFREYIVKSYKSKNVITSMNHLFSNPEFVPKIKCQIDVVNTSTHLQKTPRGYKNQSTFNKSEMNSTQKLTRLQKEKMALKESKLHLIMSKSPSHIHLKDCCNKKKPNYKQQGLLKNKSFVTLKTPKAKKKELTPSSVKKSDNNTSVNGSDTQNSTVKKLQVLKKQLAKMKTSSKESRLYDSDNDIDKLECNNLNRYYKTEVDSNDDIISSNQPLDSILKGYLDEK